MDLFQIKAPPVAPTVVITACTVSMTSTGFDWTSQAGGHPGGRPITMVIFVGFITHPLTHMPVAVPAIIGIAAILLATGLLATG